MRQLLIVFGLFLTFGCTMNPPPLAGPVSVSGKVLGSDGKPIGNLVVNLQPLQDGYVKNLEVAADGTFDVETQAGTYAYYFTPKVGSKSLPAGVAKYAMANLERTVDIAAGQELVISLP